METTRSFSPTAYEQALDDWRWLGIEAMVPVLASTFGHVFLERVDGVFFLDPIGGTMTREWRDRSELRAALATEAGRDTFLLEGLALGAHRRGVSIEPDQILVFSPPPILGGGFDIDHLMAMDFTVGMSVQGQLHQQLQAMPPGTGVSGFHLDGER